MMNLQNENLNELDLSVVIPAYQENAIGMVVSSVRDVLQAEELTFEIIVVDDGSTDNTGQIAQEAGAQVIRHPYNIGNGAAIKTGIRAARGKLLVMMDGDGQHAPRQIPDLIRDLDQYGMVVGARQKESKTAFHRDLANMIYNWLASYVCNRKIEDLTSGFRAVRTEIAREFLHLLPNTFSYPTTMTLAVARSGYPFEYIPIRVQKRMGKSKIKIIRDGLRFFLIIFKVTTLFSPLKIFVPAGLGLFLLGFGYGLYKVVVLGTRYGPTSALLMTMSGLVVLIGLVSEQLTQLRYEK
jgi:glycosyltransferase involved in cell wall biosynthesis